MLKIIKVTMESGATFVIASKTAEEALKEAKRLSLLSIIGKENDILAKGYDLDDWNNVTSLEVTCELNSVLKGE